LSLTSPTSIISADQNRNLLGELRRRHPSWYYWTIAYAVLTVICLAAGLIDERNFQGVSVWDKPFKFALSIAVYFATLGWFANLMQPNYFNTLRGKLLTGVPVVCALLEMLYILVQGARGEPSHFNVSSPFYSVMYGLMGAGAALMVATCLWMGCSILRNRGANDIWVLSVGIGLIGTFVLGGGFGFYLGGAEAHWISGETTDAGGLPLVNWSRSGGDLRVAHFFGIHAMQVIPCVGALLVWLRQRNRIGHLSAQVCLTSVSLGFAAFCIGTFIQALRGVPFI
jgi:hypothetical protein